MLLRDTANRFCGAALEAAGRCLARLPAPNRPPTEAQQELGAYVTMSLLTKRRALCATAVAVKIALLVAGLLFSAGIYPLIGCLLHPADSDTGDTMMLSLYVTLGIFR